MRIGRWKQTLFPYNPNKRKVLQFKPEEQPHSRLCTCKACNVYRLQIAALNPGRLDEDKNVLSAEAKPKQTKGLRFGEDWHKRQRRHQGMVKWRG